MNYEWDDAKAGANLAKHGVGFGAVEAFDWETAIEIVDDRQDYGEVRHIAFGFIGPDLHTLCFTERGLNIRVIMLRKASKRERRDYDKQA